MLVCFSLFRFGSSPDLALILSDKFSKTWRVRFLEFVGWQSELELNSYNKHDTQYSGSWGKTSSTCYTWPGYQKEAWSQGSKWWINKLLKKIINIRRSEWPIDWNKFVKSQSSVDKFSHSRWEIFSSLSHHALLTREKLKVNNWQGSVAKDLMDNHKL